MTIMTIRIPDDVKAAFDKAFEGEDKDAIIARLLHEAAEKRAEAGSLAERRRKAVDAILELRKQPPYASDEEIKRAREAAHETQRMVDGDCAIAHAGEGSQSPSHSMPR